MISSEAVGEDFCQACLGSHSCFPFKFMLYLYQKVIIVAENKLSDLSMDFAVKILKMIDGIKGHYSFINQLKSSTISIGANIRKAN